GMRKPPVPPADAAALAPALAAGFAAVAAAAGDGGTGPALPPFAARAARLAARAARGWTRAPSSFIRIILFQSSWNVLNLLTTLLYMKRSDMLRSSTPWSLRKARESAPCWSVGGRGDAPWK